MVEIELADNKITVEMTAGASISDGEPVYASADNEVQPASDTEIQETIGVADHNANSGNPVEVVVMGKKQVTADGAVGVGDPIVPAATAGRAVSETTAPAAHTHAMPTHSHTALTVDTDASHEAAEDRTSFVAVADGGGTFPSADIDVAAAGAATSDTALATSSDDPGDTNSADAAPPNARAFGMAITSAAGAGSTFTVLVGAKSG